MRGFRSDLCACGLSNQTRLLTHLPGLKLHQARCHAEAAPGCNCIRLAGDVDRRQMAPLSLLIHPAVPTILEGFSLLASRSPLPGLQRAPVPWTSVQHRRSGELASNRRPSRFAAWYQPGRRPRAQLPVVSALAAVNSIPVFQIARQHEALIATAQRTWCNFNAAIVVLKTNNPE